MCRYDKRTILASIEQCRQKRLNDGSVEVALRFVDKQDGFRFNRE